MNITIRHLALTGILGAGLALTTALPASAHGKGLLKADRKALHQANREVHQADSRQERDADRINRIQARATLQQDKVRVREQDRFSWLNNRHQRSANRKAALLASPKPRDVYHAHF